MQRRYFALVFSALSLTLASSVVTLSGAGASDATPRTAEVARGEYLVRFGLCNDCHTPLKMGDRGPEPDFTRALSGHPGELILPAAPAAAGRRIETRLLWQSSPGAWSFAAYVWNDAQTDAVLAPPEGLRSAAEPAPGRRHTIPSRDDCRACHDTASRPVLGFTALQLSDDRDPLAPHAEPSTDGMLTLRTLAVERLLDPMDPQLANRSPRIPGDARTRAALGYLSANCGHCHNERSDLATVPLPLLMPAFATGADVADTIASLVARTTKWDLPHSEPGTTRLATAGAPEHSAIVARMQSRRPSSQMPPLGTVVVDQAGVELVSSWIAGLRD